MMPNACPECGSEKMYLSNQAEIVCKDCGLIVEDNGIETSPYIPPSVKGHAHMPSLATAGGAKVDGMIIKHSWLYSTREKNIRDAKRKIDHVGLKHHLPQYVVKEAKMIFKAVVDRELNKGRDNNSFIYGSIYSACNIHCLPKTPLELTAFTQMTPKRMLRAYKMIVKQFNLDVQPRSPVDLIPRFGTRLGLNQPTITLALEIVMKLKGTKVMNGKHPSTIVASALYLASKLNGRKITQRDVANAIGVLEVTIRKRYREMREYL